jgi:hypothetical protein
MICSSQLLRQYGGAVSFSALMRHSLCQWIQIPTRLQRTRQGWGCPNASDGREGVGQLPISSPKHQRAPARRRIASLTQLRCHSEPQSREGTGFFLSTFVRTSHAQKSLSLLNLISLYSFSRPASSRAAAYKAICSGRTSEASTSPVMREKSNRSSRYSLIMTSRPSAGMSGCNLSDQCVRYASMACFIRHRPLGSNIHCLILGFATEYRKSVRKFTAMYVRPIARMHPWTR